MLYLMRLLERELNIEHDEAGSQVFENIKGTCDTIIDYHRTDNIFPEALASADGTYIFETKERDQIYKLIRESKKFTGILQRFVLTLQIMVDAFPENCKGVDPDDKPPAA